ncbi:hypothetical protein HDU82_003637, partial [Entophlyctis luteolus]
MSAKQFAKIINKKKMSTYDFIGMIFPNESTEPNIPTIRTSEDSNEADVSVFAELNSEIKDIINKYPEVFKPFEGLPPSRPTDLKIELEPNTKPPFRPIYSMDENELEVLKEELTFLLKH